MENHDKIYEQIKNASKKAEEMNFPAMDKVWSRVEDKLDTKVLKKQNQRWKKIAVAASVLLIVSMGYQFLKPQEIDKQDKIEKSVEITKAPEAESQIELKPDNAVTTTTQNPKIKKNADGILQKQIESQNPVAVSDVEVPVPAANAMRPAADEMKEKHEDELQKKVAGYSNMASSNDNSTNWANRKFEAKSVSKNDVFKAKSANNGTYAADKDDNAVYYKKATTTQKKTDPLYVINGEAANGQSGKDAKEELSKLSADEIDSIEVLKEPLYIINGSYYSEDELFGPKPTSPYAPLDQQEIESVKILQGKEATSSYGEKGKKGVVIITTKNKKPAAKDN